jgi:hypothetical protein
MIIATWYYAMTDLQQRQILEAQLADIDMRRSKLEMMLGNLPPITAQRSDYGRGELEDELRSLWAARSEITRQLKPSALRRSA